MANPFWPSVEQWAVIEPFMPRDQPGPEQKDDQQLISGILHVLTSDCRWRDCPAAYGPRTTVYTRFQSLVAARLLEGDADRAGQGRVGWRCGGSRQPRRPGSPVGPWQERGARAQAIGASRGGQTTKIHALNDILGRPGVLLLRPGNASDVTTALAVLVAAQGRIRRLIADKGYCADCLRTDLRNGGVTPVIPGKRSRKGRIRHDRSRYRERWCIEATFSRLKDFRRIATRYDKLFRNYASALALAAVIAFGADRVQAPSRIGPSVFR